MESVVQLKTTVNFVLSVAHGSAVPVSTPPED